MRLKRKIRISLFLAAAVCIASIYTVGSLNKRQDVFAKGPTEINLYFANDQAHLVNEKRKVAKRENMPQACMQELIAGPVNKRLAPVLPKDTVVKSVRIENKIAYVDFDKRLAENIKAGSANELLAVYSVVNTLTAQKDIDSVMILIDGKETDTLSGHIDLSQPLERRDL